MFKQLTCFPIFFSCKRVSNLTSLSVSFFFFFGHSGNGVGVGGISVSVAVSRPRFVCNLVEIMMGVEFEVVKGGLYGLRRGGAACV